MDDVLNTIYRYHEASKHRLSRYARSLGYLDWSTQPDPFLRFAGAPPRPLPDPGAARGPAWDQVAGGRALPAPLGTATISRLLWTSLALSAWKQVEGPDGRVVSRWSLRVNPSSGNLHPTEGWLACGALPGLADGPGLFHYRADRHALEQCRSFDPAAWTAALGSGRFLLALSSVAWREAWKYGERAFRYCGHDAGHALAALDLAAAALGWRTRLLDEAGDDRLGRLLGCARRRGPEEDHPDALVLVDTTDSFDDVNIDAFDALIAGASWRGDPEPLSPAHQDWPAIDEVRAAVAFAGRSWPRRPPRAPAAAPPPRPIDFAPLVRRRRSAVAMDGRTPMDASGFFRLLAGLLPDRSPRPFGLLPWPPAVSAVLFVHRVEGLEPGLYVLVRDPAHGPELRAAFHDECAWSPVDGCPPHLPLFRLGGGDLRARARDLCCHQDIAADGAFAAALLARFDAPLADAGPGMYPRLFWETGVVGQMLYLEAEAAGLQGTGIGCFFDDEVHHLLGLEGTAWQSLYHFTVGAAMRDARIHSTPAYDHLPEP